MLKKRLIFTLLYQNGHFVLSRNFRLQKVGDLKWLRSNYNFSQISYSIDELIVMNVSRDPHETEEFCAVLKELSEGCYVPIAAGGGVRSIESARNLLRSGADKVIVNTSLYKDNDFIHLLASEFGQQCVVASMDIKLSSDGCYQAWSSCGRICESDNAGMWIEKVSQSPIGEIYLNSIDRDGTGQGYDMNLLDLLPKNMTKPVILAGGVGNASHLLDGLTDSRVDAVSTAHLFNFVGDGLKKARKFIISSGVNLPLWDVQLLELHLGNNVSPKFK